MLLKGKTANYKKVAKTVLFNAKEVPKFYQASTFFLLCYEGVFDQSFRPTFSTPSSEFFRAGFGLKEHFGKARLTSFVVRREEHSAFNLV